MRNLLVLLAISIFVMSCEKDIVDPNDPTIIDNGGIAVLDTIYPQSYFPAFPGSYWNYSDGSIRTVDPEYILGQYTSSWLPYPTTMTYTDVMVPQYRFMKDGSEVTRRVYNYSFLPHSQFVQNYNPDTFYGAPNSVGSTWYTNYQGSMCMVRELITKDTSMMINGVQIDSIDIVLTYDGCLPSAPSAIEPEYWGSRNYFAKDIGLVRFDWRESSDSTYHFVEMTSYFIND
ncbi:MAG: hypothetical protein QNK23_02675 [Crocinitomicaceae bacterium]|nr:hypothetical protein [Crocinitomicaceae bacterium]